MTTPPTHTPEFLLAHLRAARVRAQLAVCEITEIGVALKAGMIDCDQALQWCDEVEALKYLVGPEAADSEIPHDDTASIPG